MAMYGEESRHLIDYRLDAKYDHWLLDEFQDTSQPQWQAVGGLVDEILQDAGGERSVFVVGDSKQSIYGWRGGEPRLFDDLQSVYQGCLAEWKMDKSFRSSEHVLDLVNSVCDLSDTKWQSIFPAEAVARWSFHEHEPSSEKEGHALVIETSVEVKASSGEKQAARYEVVKKVLEKTEPLKNRLSCVVLVTKNSQVTEMVDYLRNELSGIPVAPESETLVADGPEGSVMLDLFRWLSYPLDEFARLHLSYSPLAGVIQELTDTETPAQQWRWLTQEVAQRGVESLVQKVVQGLRKVVSLSEYGASRLGEILTAASDFSSRGGSLSEWVTFLEARKVHENSREGMVQVMTIHKSKGLGFDVVILPELGGQGFAPTNRLEMLERKGDLGSTEFIIRKPAKEICLADNALHTMLTSWEAEQCYERFCNLYVALTRAKHATYCILDPVKENWKPADKFDDWIRESTARSGIEEAEIMGEVYPVLFESGNWLQLSQEVTATEEASNVLPTLKKAKPRVSRRIASAEKDGSLDSLLESSKGAVFGNLVHECFERITWIDELPDFDKKAAATTVTKCLAVPEIREFFKRPQGDYQLLREQPFETQIQGAWLSGIIDRAVISLEDGQPTKVSIIDFKTDRKNAAELTALYAGQLQTYRQAMARITGVPEDAISCHLLSTHLQEMVEIE